MINAQTIAEILSLYKKHGWNLRRVLLSDALRVNITDALQDLFSGAEIVSSPYKRRLVFAPVKKRS